MKKEERLNEVANTIVEWYQKNGRALPWRKSKNAYTIWISEIMLQQTKIEAVKKYYERFMKEIPTIQELAKIEEEKLLKLWEGLGYYNRARNLKKAACKIEETYHGKMPSTYEELKELPGIGEYTAGAIASIAYNEKIPAVDGNVLRVVSRILASSKDVLLSETKKEMTSILKEIMPNQAGDFNEGLMELGELICIPNGVPFCEQCPIKDYCIAYKENKVGEIPVRNKKIKRKVEDRIVYVLTCNNKIAIQKRREIGLLANLYEFPNIIKEELVEKVIQNWNLKEKAKKKIGEHKHVFSHIEWNMVGYQIEVERENTDFIWVSMEELNTRYPIPTAFQYFKEKIKEK